MYKSLLTKKGRREHGLFLMQGNKAINENRHLATKIITKLDNPKLHRELNTLENSTDDIGVFRMPVSNGRQVVAPTLVLDHIQDPGNMGTILRTAVAFGWTNIITIDCVDVYSPKVIRAISGQIFKLNIDDLTIDEFVIHATGVGAAPLQIVIADIDGKAISRGDHWSSVSHIALVLGNEGAGVREEIRNLPHTKVSIPMQNDVESLNVAIAGSILMWYLR